MRILSPAFVGHYAGRLMNIHPSLLPKYPGLHTHRQVLENGDEEHGTSVHFVTDELDGGPVILQAKVPVFDGDTEDDITERVQSQEHAIYPLVVSWFVDGRLAMRDGAARLDGMKLPPAGLRGRRVVCSVGWRSSAYPTNKAHYPIFPSPTF